ncbi:hypothetical protein ACN9J3_06170 [Aliarcobacter butzleri]|uniref:hypothetical protein n=1 Tax=Aliarcobacter butzleri TaxID=28197 RepID=UPI003B215BB6
MAVTELVNKISFVGSLQPLERLNAGLSTSIKAIGLSSVAYGTMAVALNSWVDKTTEAIYQTTNLSKELGVNVESMQQWEYVAKMNGSTADALQSSIGGLSERIGEYAKFDSGEGKEVFEKLGISVKDAEGKIKSADVVMQDLAKSMQGLNVSEQRSIVAKLGIDESMLQTLRLTDTQINHLKDSASAWGLVTEEQAEELTKYKRSLTDLGYGFDAVKTQLAIAFIPVLEELTTGFKELFKENRESIQNGLSKSIEVIMSFGMALFNTGRFIKTTLTEFDGLGIILGALTLRFLYLNRAMLLNPLGLFVAGVVLAIGVIDDLVIAFDGGESVIADFFASFNIDIVKALTGAFDILKGTWNGLLATLLSLSEGIVALFAILEKGGKFVGLDFGLGIEEQYLKIKALREEYEKLSKNQIKGALENGIKIDSTKGIGSVLEKNSNPLNYNDLGNVHLPPNVPILKDNALLPNNIANNTNTATTNNNTQNNNIKIDVRSDNPTIAGQTVVDSLNKQISNANKHYDVGGR